MGCFILTDIISINKALMLENKFFFSRAGTRLRQKRHSLQSVARRGSSFQGPRVGCLTPGNELWEGTHQLTEVEVLLRKGALGREQQGEGTQDCSASWLTAWLLW